jgi:surface polysaccharide O-acyltransferase-like enzyme
LAELAVGLQRPARVGEPFPARLPEVDLLKAIGIAVVVLIHSARAPWDPNATPLEVWLGSATRFAVPAFLFASGYLTAGDPAPLASLAARLRRLLVPYLLASLLAEIFRVWYGNPWTLRSVIEDVAFGNAFGPYYYVFVALQLTLLVPILAAVPRLSFALVFVASLAWQVWSELGFWIPAPLFWDLRIGARWAPYFLLGWWLAERRVMVSEAAQRHGTPLLAGLAALVISLLAGMAVVERASFAGRALAWSHVYAMIALLMVLALRVQRLVPSLTYLSDSTYFIYLYHLLVVYTVVSYRLAPSDRFELIWLAGAWLAGLGVPLLALLALQRRFGARTRIWLGA